MASRRVALIGCSKTKREGVHEAKDLYDASPLFRASYEYAERTCDEIVILSAQYYVLHPEMEIASYERVLSEMSRKERACWQQHVLIELFFWYLKNNDTIVWLCGKDYCDDGLKVPMTRQLECTHEEPLAGMQIGERLSFLNKENGKGDDGE